MRGTRRAARLAAYFRRDSQPCHGRKISPPIYRVVIPDESNPLPLSDVSAVDVLGGQIIMNKAANVSSTTRRFTGAKYFIQRN